MKTRGALAALAALTAGGCATTVPRMADYGRSEVQHYVAESNLVGHVKCEIHRAVQTVLAEDAYARDPARSAAWLRGWGAKVTLKLAVEEKAALAPSFGFANPMRNVVKSFPSGGLVTVPQNQSTGLGASIGSAATRTETIGFFYSFKELLEGQPIVSACASPSRGVLHGDLRIQSFLDAKIQHTQVMNHLPRKAGQSPYSTLTYQVGFVITRAANVTPGWKLQYYLINPTAPLLSGSRANTHDLTLTLGPVEQAGPSQAVRDAHLAAMIGDEVARAISARSR